MQPAEYVQILHELARLRADHDRRVAELLEANNGEVERRLVELEEAYNAVRVYAGHIDEFTKDDLRRAGLVSKKVERQP